MQENLLEGGSDLRLTKLKGYFAPRASKQLQRQKIEPSLETPFKAKPISAANQSPDSSAQFPNTPSLDGWGALKGVWTPLFCLSCF